MSMHSMLQSDFRDVVSPTFYNISRLNDTARVFAVYAWQLGYPSPPKTRLAACWLGFGRAEFASAGFHPQVSRRHRFLLFPFARLGLAQLIFRKAHSEPFFGPFASPSGRGT